MVVDQPSFVPLLAFRAAYSLLQATGRGHRALLDSPWQEQYCTSRPGPGRLGLCTTMVISILHVKRYPVQQAGNAQLGALVKLTPGAHPRLHAARPPPSSFSAASKVSACRDWRTRDSCSPQQGSAKCRGGSQKDLMAEVVVLKNFNHEKPSLRTSGIVRARNQ